MTTLEDLLLLQDGWDGRRAPAPSKEAVCLARQVVLNVDAIGRIAPDVEGGVTVYFFGGGEHVDGGWNRQGGIILSNDGELVLYLRDRLQAGSQVSCLTAGDIGQAVERIHQFLEGKANGF